MCVIINKKPGVVFPFDDIEAALENNPDGFGIMWVENGRVQVQRMLNANPLDIMDLQRKLKDKWAVMHFRYTTHGATDINNVHPFPVCTMEEDGIDIYMAHNGTISGPNPIKQESDTRAFIREILRPILSTNPDVLYLPGFQKMVDDYIDWSKLSFLTSDGNIITINEGSGDKRHGCWVSNTHSFDNWYRYGSYRSCSYGNTGNRGSSSSAGTGTHQTSRAWDYLEDDEEEKATVSDLFKDTPAAANGHAGRNIGNTNPVGKTWIADGEEITADQIKFMTGWELEMFCEAHPVLAAKVMQDLIYS